MFGYLKHSLGHLPFNYILLSLAYLDRVVSKTIELDFCIYVYGHLTIHNGPHQQVSIV